jgi:Trp operon repressor
MVTEEIGAVHRRFHEMSKLLQVLMGRREIKRQLQLLAAGNVSYI